MKLERNAAVAGFLIGLGVIINTLATNPTIGALLFSFGLLTIIELGLPLYTGQIGFIAEKQAADLVKIFCFNLFGIAFIILIKVLTDVDFTTLLVQKASMKFDKSMFRMFVDGFLCGTLIHFAVKCKKPLLTVMSITIFILIGAEHCIADMAYIVCVPSLLNYLKFLMVVMGNSFGAIFLENMLKQKGKQL